MRSVRMQVFAKMEVFGYGYVLKAVFHDDRLELL